MGCAHWDHLGSGKKYQRLVPSPARTVWQRGKRPGPQDVNPWGGSDTPRESRGRLLSTPALAGLLLGVGIASEDTQSRQSPGPADTCQVFSMSLHSVNRLVWTVSSSLTVRDALSTTLQEWCLEPMALQQIVKVVESWQKYAGSKAQKKN